MKEMIANNEVVLKCMHDKLVTLEPGTPEYRELLKDTIELSKVQAELKKAKPEFWLKIFSVAGPLFGTLLLYGASIYVDNSEYIKPKVASNVEKFMSPWKR